MLAFHNSKETFVQSQCVWPCTLINHKYFQRGLKEPGQTDLTFLNILIGIYICFDHLLAYLHACLQILVLIKWTKLSGSWAYHWPKVQWHIKLAKKHYAWMMHDWYFHNKYIWRYELWTSLCSFLRGVAPHTSLLFLVDSCSCEHSYL